MPTSNNPGRSEILHNPRYNRGTAFSLERILGLGDLGVGGMGIPIGKLSLYTAY